MNPRTLAAPLLIALAVAFGGPSSAQDNRWSPEQIKAEWAGKKLFVRSANGQMMDLWFKEDGGLELAANNFSDTGVWRLSDNGYCAKWQKIRNGEERCFTVGTRLGQTFVYNLDGSLSGSVMRAVAP